MERRLKFVINKEIAALMAEFLYFFEKAVEGGASNRPAATEVAGGAFREDWVIIEGGVSQRLLQQYIAKYSQGQTCSGIRFLYWEEWAEQVEKLLSASGAGSLAKEGRFRDNCYHRTTLQWVIMGIFNELLGRRAGASPATLRGDLAEVQALRSYLEQVGTEELRLRLAGQLGNIFEEYIFSREDWLKAWEEQQPIGKFIDKETAQTLAFRGIKGEIARWQGWLWCEIRQILASQHKAEQLRTLAQTILTLAKQRPEAQESPFRHVKRLFFFDVNYFPLPYGALLRAFLAEEVAVYYFKWDVAAGSTDKAVKRLLQENTDKDEAYAFSKRLALGTKRDDFYQLMHLLLSPQQILVVKNFSEIEKNQLASQEEVLKITARKENDAEKTTWQTQTNEPTPAAKGALAGGGADVLAALKAYLFHYSAVEQANDQAKVLLAQFLLALHKEHVDEDKGANTRHHQRKLRFYGAGHQYQEVEILHELLVNLFKEDSTLEPSDICIVAPNIEVYEPYLRDIFTRGNVLPIALRAASRYKQSYYGYIQLLTLMQKELWQRDDFNALINIEGITLATAEQQTLLPGAIELWHKVITYIFTTLTSTALFIDRQDVSFSLSAVLEVMRKLLREVHSTTATSLLAAIPPQVPITEPTGLATALYRSSPAQQQGTSPTVFTGSPAAAAEPSLVLAGAELSYLAHYINGLDLLVTYQNRLQRKQNLVEWRKFFLGLTRELWNGQAESSMALESLLQQLFRRLLGFDTTQSDVGAKAAKVTTTPAAPLVQFCKKQRYAYTTIFATVKQALVKKKAQSGPFLNGSIVCGSLLQLRHYSAKVTVLLGMKRGVFPQEQAHFELELLAEQPEINDRSLAKDAEMLFLERLMATTSTIIVSLAAKELEAFSQSKLAPDSTDPGQEIKELYQAFMRQLAAPIVEVLYFLAKNIEMQLDDILGYAKARGVALAINEEEEAFFTLWKYIYERPITEPRGAIPLLTPPLLCEQVVTQPMTTVLTSALAHKQDQALVAEANLGGNIRFSMQKTTAQQAEKVPKDINALKQSIQRSYAYMNEFLTPNATKTLFLTYGQDNGGEIRSCDLSTLRWLQARYVKFLSSRIDSAHRSHLEDAVVAPNRWNLAVRLAKITGDEDLILKKWIAEQTLRESNLIPLGRLPQGDRVNFFLVSTMKQFFANPLAWYVQNYFHLKRKLFAFPLGHHLPTMNTKQAVQLSEDIATNDKPIRFSIENILPKSTRQKWEFARAVKEQLTGEKRISPILAMPSKDRSQGDVPQWESEQITQLQKFPPVPPPAGQEEKLVAYQDLSLGVQWTRHYAAIKERIWGLIAPKTSPGALLEWGTLAGAVVLGNTQNKLVLQGNSLYVARLIDKTPPPTAQSTVRVKDFSTQTQSYTPYKVVRVGSGATLLKNWLEWFLEGLWLTALPLTASSWQPNGILWKGDDTTTSPEQAIALPQAAGARKIEPLWVVLQDKAIYMESFIYKMLPLPLAVARRGLELLLGWKLYGMHVALPLFEYGTKAILEEFAKKIKKLPAASVFTESWGQNTCQGEENEALTQDFYLGMLEKVANNWHAKDNHPPDKYHYNKNYAFNQVVLNNEILSQAMTKITKPAADVTYQRFQAASQDILWASARVKLAGKQKFPTLDTVEGMVLHLGITYGYLYEILKLLQPYLVKVIPLKPY